ncbi:MAG: formate dehydrogenase accessory sulfurtransferase FdhD [Dehalococcoidia bacterium]
MSHGGTGNLLADDEDEALHPPRPGSTTRARVVVVADGAPHEVSDLLATEEPLEIRLVSGPTSRTVAITMRTPGADFELAAGFLHGEQVIARARDIRRITYCVDRSIDATQRYNIVNVELRDGVEPDLRPLERTFLTTSACGVCGKASLDALHLRGCPSVPSGPLVANDILYALPETLRRSQGLFATTGGLHAAALFDPAGTLLAVREDIGRHNAVDKLVGWALLEGLMPLHNALLLVSGRTSYEILQKALVAGIPFVSSISAPSSLAVKLAEEFGMTLVGFLRGGRFNIYAGAQRIPLAQPV